MAGIGERIKGLRDKRGWSQLDLAKKSGINNSVLSRIESGKRPVEDHEIKIFAEIFEVGADFLLGISEKSSGPINTAFHDFDNLTEEEKKHLELQLEIYRELKKREKK